ncbi:MAG: hypothetical protein LZF62_360005 [Nitrospira sp.]|nr:MAG: hypothetical protein LZF62_360005 [Nitrospira sp.]
MRSGEGGEDIDLADESHIGSVMVNDRCAGNMSGQHFDGDGHSVLSGMELYGIRPHNLTDSFKTSRWNTYGGHSDSFPCNGPLLLLCCSANPVPVRVMVRTRQFHCT